MSLTQEDVWLFRHNGFVHVKERLPEELVHRLSEVTDAHVREKIEPIIWESSEEYGADGEDGRDVVRRLSKIIDRDSVYLEAATHPIALDALEAILGPNIELLTNKHNHIMVRPGGSAPVPWHRGEELYSRPLMTVLIYIDESTMENGCVRLVPGSHQIPLSSPRRPKGLPFREHSLFYQSVPMPMPSGGVLIFNDALFHGADKNLASTPRRSMTLAFQGHDLHLVRKADPEKIIVRGERAYEGHPVPAHLLKS
ncbi:MAG: phytanoyl-CoA dioxygenase family protein [Candidatus Poribacteria bacterium]|nr:phytanoyl-CoA dioxygenase family protein [Candidatus Poribacteria bacterium]